MSTALCPRCPNKQLKILCASLVLHPFSRSGLSMIVFLVRSDLKRQKVKYLENVWEVKWDNNRKQTNKNNRNYSLKPLFAYFSFWWTVPLLPFSINQHYTQRHQPQAMRSPSKCISICSVVVEFPELSMHSQRTMQIGGTVKSKTTQKHKQRKAYPYGVGAFCLYWTIVLGKKNREMCFLTVPHICMCIFLCVCVWVCRWWRRSRVWSEEKNIVWIIHKGQKVTVNESVTGH